MVERDQKVVEVDVLEGRRGLLGEVQLLREDLELKINHFVIKFCLTKLIHTLKKLRLKGCLALLYPQLQTQGL